MAQVTSGTVYTNTLANTKFYLSWSRESYDVSLNESKINWTAGIVISNGQYWLSNAVKITSIYIDGVKVSSGGTYSNIYGPTTGTQLLSGTTKVKHKDDGTKSFTASISGWLWETGSPTGSGTFELVPIPRYATSVQSLNSKTETTISMKWSSDSTVDYIWYSKDNGSNWTGIDVTDGTSGSYTISGLSANTTYNIKTRVRRKDSQLTTDSSSLSITTYDYPYCTDSPNFTIGNYFTLSFYNPLGRSIKIYLIGANGAEKGGDTITGTSLGGYTNDDWKNWLYSTIPSAKNGKYQVKVVYGSVTKTRNAGNTYSIKGTEKPTIGTITYADTNTTVTAITGDSSKIVQNQSNLKVTFTKATALNSATISKHTFELNGVVKTSTSASGSVDFGKIDSANSLTLKVTVTDSRGLTTSTTKTISMLEHSNPTALVTLKRLNNYEDESYLTVDGSVSSVNGKNTMAIKYRYKVSGGTYGTTYTTIKDNTKYTLSLDKNNAYIFEIVITDAFGSTYSREHTLGKGVFPLFIDTEKQSLGMNALPRAERIFELDGRLVESEKEFSIPTTIGGKTGWYLAMSGEFEYATSKTFVISINEVLAGGTGMLCLGMRYQNDTLTIKRFEWLTANGIASSNVKLATSGSKFYLYLRTTEDWQQYYLKVLQEKVLGGWNFRQYTVHYPTLEDTVEEPDGINPSGMVVVSGKASKNLFNGNSYVYTNANNSGTPTIINANELSVPFANTWSRLKVKITGLEPNSTYTISAYLDKSNYSSDVGSGFYDGSNYQDNAFTKGSGNVYLTFTSSSNGTFDIFFYGNWSGTSYSGSIVYKNIQLEKGSTKTSYEEYFEPNIYVKDSNGEFQDVEINKNNYSYGEQIIGTWIDGKPLYRRVYDVGALPSANGYKSVALYINNLDTVTNLRGMMHRPSDNYRFVIPYSEVNIYMDNNDKFTIHSTVNRSAFNGIVIIEYTKTTD